MKPNFSDQCRSALAMCRGVGVGLNKDKNFPLTKLKSKCIHIMTEIQQPTNLLINLQHSQLNMMSELGCRSRAEPSIGILSKNEYCFLLAIISYKGYNYILYHMSIVIFYNIFNFCFGSCLGFLPSD